MKTLNLNLRRVRSSVRTDVSTGSRKGQSGAGSYGNAPGLPTAPSPPPSLIAMVKAPAAS